MPKNPTKPKTSLENDQVPIKFNLPVEMPSVYSTNIVVQTLEHEVLISFYEIQPPLLIGGTPEQNLAFIKKTGLRADCVSRITIAKGRLETFADVFRKAVNDMKALEKQEKNA